MVALKRIYTFFMRYRRILFICLILLSIFYYCMWDTAYAINSQYLSRYTEIHPRHDPTNKLDILSGIMHQLAANHPTYNRETPEAYTKWFGYGQFMTGDSLRFLKTLVMYLEDHVKISEIREEFLELLKYYDINYIEQRGKELIEKFKTMDLNNPGYCGGPILMEAMEEALERILEMKKKSWLCRLYPYRNYIAWGFTGCLFGTYLFFGGPFKLTLISQIISKITENGS